MKGKDYFWNRMLFQLVNGGFSDEIHFISKANCQVMNSSKKWRNEFVVTSMWCVFVRFLEEIEDFKKVFRNYYYTIFGTWRKSYCAKFVLVESISTSTNFRKKSPTCTISTNTKFHQFARPQYTAPFMIPPFSTMEPKSLWNHIINNDF